MHSSVQNINQREGDQLKEVTELDGFRGNFHEKVVIPEDVSLANSFNCLNLLCQFYEHVTRQQSKAM